MKDRKPNDTYEVFRTYGYFPGIRQSDKEVARIHVGIKEAGEVIEQKTIYRHFETVRKYLGVKVPKPLFTWRTYVAEDRKKRKAYELNNPRR